MPRAAAIILQNESLALIERNRDGHVYYVFPGGQIEGGESQTETLIREIKEELGLLVQPGSMIAEVIFQGDSQFHYLAEVVGGEFGTGTGVDIQNLKPTTFGTYTPVLMPLTKVLGVDIRPRAVAEIVVLAQIHGWPDVAAHFHEGG